MDTYELILRACARCDVTDGMELAQQLLLYIKGFF